MLTRGEVEKLLAQPRGSEPAALRDRALLELMYACGLRASEAIGLEVGDVDLEDRVLRARGKGSKERVVPIGQVAARAVASYLERGRAALVKGRPEPQLFVNFRGAALTRQGLYKIVRRHARDRRAGGPDEPAHAAAQLRDPPAGRRLRPALGAGDARPRRRVHHPALHPPLERAPEGRVLPGAPARDGRLSDALLDEGMPELPEVETIRRQLAPALEGRRLRERGGPGPALVRPGAARGDLGRPRRAA